MITTDGVNGSPTPANLMSTQYRLLVCNSGQHELKEIFRTREDAAGVCEVVRWCQVCGSVVVDTDVDGRVKKGDIMKMQVSRVAQAAFDEFELRK